jgi:hypothetical protein
VNVECISVEGTSRSVFDSINGMIGWPAAPQPSKASAAASQPAANNFFAFAQKRELRPGVEQ